MSGEDRVAEDCSPPDPSRKGAADLKERSCIICGKTMYYAADFQVHVCLNKDVHGVLAYYVNDDCYFTSRDDIGYRFLKEGKKFHMIQPEVLQMIGVEP